MKTPIAISALSNIPLLGQFAEIRRALNGIRSLVMFLEARGVKRDEVTALLELADQEGRDLTDSEVAAAIGAAQTAIDRLREASGEELDEPPAPEENQPENIDPPENNS